MIIMVKKQNRRDSVFDHYLALQKRFALYQNLFSVYQPSYTDYKTPPLLLRTLAGLWCVLFFCICRPLAENIFDENPCLKFHLCDSPRCLTVFCYQSVIEKVTRASLDRIRARTVATSLRLILESGEQLKSSSTPLTIPAR